MTQFENCIAEILVQERIEEKRKQYIYNILNNDYFQKVLSFISKESKWYSIKNKLNENLYEYVYESLLNGIKQ